MKTKADKWIRVLGLSLGVGLAAFIVLSSRIPPGTGVLGADIIVASGPSGELAVTPAGPFLSATNMTPASNPASGELEIFNQTGGTLAVSVRGLPSTDDLDAVLMVHVEADGNTLFEGNLGAFRAWTKQTVSLASGQTSKITVETWLDPQAQAWTGRVAQIGLEFDSNTVGAA